MRDPGLFTAANPQTIERVQLLANWYAGSWADAVTTVYNGSTVTQGTEIIRCGDPAGLINYDFARLADQNFNLYLPEGMNVVVWQPDDSVDGHYELLHAGQYPLKAPMPFAIGQLNKTLNSGDSSAQVSVLLPGGGFSGIVYALNPLSCTGSIGGYCVLMANYQTGSVDNYPYMVIGMQTFATNVMESVTYNYQTGQLVGNYMLAALSGPTIFANESLNSPQIITTAVDAGSDLQRDATTVGAPSISPSSPTFGQNVTLSATVSHASGVANPTGYISFIVGGSVVATTIVTLSGGGVGSVTVTSDTLPDSGSMYAQYNGDSSYSQSTSSSSTSYSLTAATPTVTLTVQEQSAPSTNITTSTYGDALNLTASVYLSSPNTSIVLNGTVTFKQGTTVLGTAATILSSTANTYQAVFPCNWLAVGSNALSAVFSASDSAQMHNATGTESLTVNKAQLTITANDYSMTYGMTPSFTATPTGFVLTDNSSVITGSFTFNSIGSNTSGVGSYPIIVSIGSAAATNYTFTFVRGTLTILQAPLTVTANDMTFSSGKNVNAPTSYGYTLSGVQNSDIITSSVANPYPNTNIPGFYSLVPSSPTGTHISDYTVTLVAGVLTVT